jgi:hypothetical protein
MCLHVRRQGRRVQHSVPSQAGRLLESRSSVQMLGNVLWHLPASLSQVVRGNRLQTSGANKGVACGPLIGELSGSLSPEN